MVDYYTYGQELEAHYRGTADILDRYNRTIGYVEQIEALVQNNEDIFGALGGHVKLQKAYEYLQAKVEDDREIRARQGK